VSAMGPSECDQRDTVSTYLLGALPAYEAYTFEQHLAGCAECRGDMHELSSAVDVLGCDVPAVAAPLELGDRIKGIVRAEAELLRAAGPEADRPVKAPRRRARVPRLSLRPRFAVAGTLAFGVICGLVIGASLVGTTTTRTRAISAEILQPGVPQDASATLHISGQSGTLSFANFPSPPAGRVYEVWLEGAGRSPRPTDALFSVNSSGDGTVAVPGSLRGVRQILVTAEPLGGSTVPSRSPIISAST
jgi:hypothetical protein